MTERSTFFDLNSFATYLIPHFLALSLMTFFFFLFLFLSQKFTNRSFFGRPMVVTLFLCTIQVHEGSTGPTIAIWRELLFLFLEKIWSYSDQDSKALSTLPFFSSLVLGFGRVLNNSVRFHSLCENDSKSPTKFIAHISHCSSHICGFGELPLPLHQHQIQN